MPLRQHFCLIVHVIFLLKKDNLLKLAAASQLEPTHNNCSWLFSIFQWAFCDSKMCKITFKGRHIQRLLSFAASLVDNKMAYHSGLAWNWFTIFTAACIAHKAGYGSETSQLLMAAHGFG